MTWLLHGATACACRYGSWRSPGRQWHLQRDYRLTSSPSHMPGQAGRRPRRPKSWRGSCIVPRIFALVGLLDLDQPEVVHHQIVVAELAVAGEEILDRLLAHFRCDLQRIIGTTILDGLQIMHDG